MYGNGNANSSGAGSTQQAMFRYGSDNAQAGNCTGDCTGEMYMYGNGNANPSGAGSTQQAMFRYGSDNAQAGNCTGDCTGEMHMLRDEPGWFIPEEAVRCRAGDHPCHRRADERTHLKKKYDN